MKICIINHTRTILKPVEDLAKELNLGIVTAEHEDAPAVIKKHAPSIVLINMADTGTHELCSKIRQIKLKNGYIYIILTGTKEMTSEIFMSISDSADDYLIMPFTKDELMIKLHIAVRVAGVYNNLANTKKKLLMHAKEDPVTGVLNRRSLLDEIHNEMGRAARKDEFSCAIMIKINNYENMLAESGYKSMDAFMGEFSKLLKKTVRPYDKLGKYGPDRFLIFLPNTNNINAKVIAKRIITEIESRKFRFRDTVFKPSFAIGISELDPQDMGKSKDADAPLINDLIMDSFIRRAATASDRAFEKGENRIEVYTFT